MRIQYFRGILIHHMPWLQKSLLLFYYYTIIIQFKIKLFSWPSLEFFAVQWWLATCGLWQILHQMLSQYTHYIIGCQEHRRWLKMKSRRECHWNRIMWETQMLQNCGVQMVTTGSMNLTYCMPSTAVMRLTNITWHQLLLSPGDFQLLSEAVLTRT